jgi:ribonuclease PH
MKNFVCSVAIGKQDKEFIIDLTKEEEDFEDGEGATDFAVAKIANSDEFSLLQLDGKIQPEVVKELLTFSEGAFDKIYEFQKKILKEVIEK